MDGSLGTTNLLLGIMAVVAVIEACAVIGAGIFGLMMYRRAMELVRGLESRQVEPAMARLNAILDDLKEVSATVKEETGRVDQAVRTTIDRVDDTADRVRSNLRVKASWLVGILRGVRAAVEEILNTEKREHATGT